MKIGFDSSGSFVKVKASGLFNVTDANVRIITILTTCHMLQVDRLLIDFREVEGLITDTAKLLVATEVERQFLTHFAPYGRRLAIAFLGIPPQLENETKIPSCIQASNLSTIQTVDEQDAVSWLESHMGS